MPRLEGPPSSPDNWRFQPPKAEDFEDDDEEEYDDYEDDNLSDEEFESRPPQRTSPFANGAPRIDASSNFLPRASDLELALEQPEPLLLPALSEVADFSRFFPLILQASTWYQRYIAQQDKAARPSSLSKSPLTLSQARRSLEYSSNTFLRNPEEKQQREELLNRRRQEITETEKAWNAAFEALAQSWIYPFVQEFIVPEPQEKPSKKRETLGDVESIRLPDIPTWPTYHDDLRGYTQPSDLVATWKSYMLLRRLRGEVPGKSDTSTKEHDPITQLLTRLNTLAVQLLENTHSTEQAQKFLTQLRQKKEATLQFQGSLSEQMALLQTSWMARLWETLQPTRISVFPHTKDAAPYPPSTDQLSELVSEEDERVSSHVIRERLNQLTVEEMLRRLAFLEPPTLPRQELPQLQTSVTPTIIALAAEWLHSDLEQYVQRRNPQDLKLLQNARSWLQWATHQGRFTDSLASTALQRMDELHQRLTLASEQITRNRDRALEHPILQTLEDPDVNTAFILQTVLGQLLAQQDQLEQLNASVRLLTDRPQ